MFFLFGCVLVSIGIPTSPLMGTGHQWWGPWSASPFKLLAVAGSREPPGVTKHEAWSRYVSEDMGI